MKSYGRLNRAFWLSAATIGLLAWTARAADIQVNVNAQTPAGNEGITLSAGQGDDGDHDDPPGDKRHRHKAGAAPEPSLWLELGTLLVLGVGLTALRQAKKPTPPSTGLATP